jgi:hypothetical protein
MQRALIKRLNLGTLQYQYCIFVQEGLDRLSHAMEDADEGMEAALRRAEEVHQLAATRKDKEIAELRSVIACKEHDIDSLRESVSSIKRTLESRLREQDDEVASRDEQVHFQHQSA